MVNHFASLLLNIAGEKISSENKSYFTARDYIPVTLPIRLQEFYNMLFPIDTSFYQKQFLCYNYLRLLQSTNFIGFDNYDPRITYELDALTEYFRVKNISTPISSDFQFNLFAYGEYTPTNQNSYYYNSFTVRQVNNLSQVTIFSDIDKLYYNNAGFKNTPASDMNVTISQLSGSTTLTNPIYIGGTGLYFTISGPLSTFTSTSNKYWNFIAESPMVFDFPDLLKKLKQRETTVDRMLEYGTAPDDSTNENLWRQHFNDVYKFAGLINAYVAKVNNIWDKNLA